MTPTQIIQKLQNNGHQAVFVGGCVRDRILNREAKDWDTATSALPEQVENLFDNTLPLGKSFGVIVVEGHEVATFRSDGPGRKPTVAFGSSLEDDLARRDFTMNAIAWDPISDEFIDPFCGRIDVLAGDIRAVGSAKDRFDEDPLRLLRAARFASQLNFDIDRNTVNAMFFRNLEGVSAERIKQEMDKLLLSDNPRRGLDVLMGTGLMKQILPELCPLMFTRQRLDFHPEGDVWTHTLNVVGRTPPEHALRWAALLHDIGKPEVTDGEGKAKGHERVSVKMARAIMHRLKFSNEERDSVLFLIAEHMRIKQFWKMRISKQWLLMAHPQFLQLALFAGADREVGPDPTPSLIEHFDQMPEMPQPFLDGEDLKKFAKPGPVFGRVLEHVFLQQLEDKIKDKGSAMNRAEQLIRNWA